ncbi:hypothetical protein F2Q70_00016580 [Brassica cretica]|uniref:FRIGIDA-like protein n=1 Tax=Brassica cretica TaxID=69181 RepID=A0A8S9HQU7_BRACR|nr:hypothetical protein F2Q70_00016580 [Brassica cretica]
MGEDDRRQGHLAHGRGRPAPRSPRPWFVSLIDGMISECGSEASRLARDLSEMQGKWSETEAILKAIEVSHSAKVSKLEAEIGELERDLGKTASSLLKEKKSRKAKSSEARLAKISSFLGSLECIRSRDLALAAVEGGMAVVRALQSETPPSLQAEETRLSDCKGALAAVDGDFDLVLAYLKSACFLLVSKPVTTESIPEIFRGCEPRNVEKRISLDEVSIISKDDPHRGHLAHGRGQPAPRSPRPWARTTSTEVTSPMGEDDPHRGHLAHGRARPAPRSPRPWARTTRTEVTSPMGEDRPPVPKPCILV